MAESADARAVAAMGGVVGVHRNTTGWYNNASFALPLAATVVVLVAGLAVRRTDVLAFGGFLAVVTVLMVPVVLATWRTTPTAVVLTRETIVSLHNGRVLKQLPWSAVTAVTRRETQGNVRWLVSTAAGEHVALEGELADLPRLIASARRLAGLPTEP